MAGIGAHTKQVRGATDDWITPRHVIKALGPFDLDPCACTPQPWPCAERQYTFIENGLLHDWSGSVWLNPPYGDRVGTWMHRLAEHGDGIALIFARTETEFFYQYVWRRATSALFLKGRLTFHRPDGSKPSANSGGPSVLVAYGSSANERLNRCGLPGGYVIIGGSAT